jgi:predicted negative regulator of RcsB-dependent stress response
MKFKRLVFCLALLGGCATAKQTKSQLYQAVVACTQTTKPQEVRAEAINCLNGSNPSNYSACLEPLAVTWTADEIECVAGYYEASQKSDAGQ